MENRRKNRRFPAVPRLLTLFFLITPVFPVFSDPSLPGAIVRIIPDSKIHVGQVVAIELSVPAVPLNELQLDISSLPSTFTHVAGRRDRRVQKTGEIESVIVLEYLVQQAGFHFIGPFVITSSQGDAVLPAVRIEVIETQEAEVASVRWHILGTELRTGEPQILQLQIRNSQDLLDFDVSVPERSILELLGTMPLSGFSVDYSVVAEYRWTALAPGHITLPVAVVSLLDGSGEKVIVSSAEHSVQFTGTVSSTVSSDNSMKNDVHQSDALLFRAFEPLQAGGNDFPPLPSVLDEYPDLIPDWSPERVYRVLAGLRALEYRSLRPRQHRKIREELESMLDLPATHSVSRGYWRSALLFVAITVLSIALMLYLLTLRHSFFRSFAHIFLLIGIFIAGYAVILYIEASQPVVIVSSTAVYTIPDTKGNILVQLVGGQTVMLRKVVGDWLLVRTHSGYDGWVDRQAAVFYGEDNEFW